MKKRIIALLCVAAMGLSLFGCGSSAEKETANSAASTASTSSSSASSADKKVVLGISFGQNVHPFFVAMQKGAEDAAKEKGVELVVQSADSSLEKQVTQIENLVQRGVNAILLNPYDSEGVAPAAQAALDKGVGIFTMDINVTGAEATSFVASNNVKIGEMLADYVIKELGGKGKIALLGGPTVTSLKDREDGFVNKIKTSGIEIVANQGVAMERTTSLAGAETILQANPDIKAFVGVNENSAMGIVSAAAAQGKKDLIITGVDSTEDVMNGIKGGTISVGVAQDPYQMGYMAVENAIKWANGETVEKNIEVPVEYMNKDNIDTFIKREADYAAKK
jgi:ribose transport system substrate-binding protein